MHARTNKFAMWCECGMCTDRLSDSTKLSCIRRVGVGDGVNWTIIVVVVVVFYAEAAQNTKKA